MSRVHRASWILPIDAPPIRDGWVEVDHGQIIGLGGSPRPDSEPGTANPEREPRTRNDEPRTVILPALVNAHTHLELSWMRGRVPPGDTMPDWAARLISERQRGDSIQQRSTAGADFRRDAIAGAISRLLHDRDQARRLGATGRAKVLRELTWDQIYAKVRAIYDEVVGVEGQGAKDERPA